ncbi:MAG: aspartate kinase [Patescibacteria group bacterium]
MTHSIKVQGHGEDNRTTKVLKFGGTSVADAKNINRVIDIVLANEPNTVVVVSALGGITDELIKLATLASKGDSKYKIIFSSICERHDKVVKELIKPENLEKVLLEINKKYSELGELIKNIFTAKELSLVSLDAVMSSGEQLSAYIISEAIKNQDVSCEFVDARALIKTDNNFGGANVDLATSYKLISNFLKNKNIFSVMGGFIASTEAGETTTLSRGGSDYTAALVGAALDASIIEIWTDVDGLMTADPKKMKDALLIPEISYSQAEEMAYSGAKVIHPKTIKPAVLKGIPIYIKNTFNPKGSGTKISNDTAKSK